MLVQYPFSIPGSSTEVERLYSIINDIWTPDKGQMSLETLEAYLNVKVNSDLNCSSYYALIKGNMTLLSKVHSSQKYVSETEPFSSTQ